MAVVGSAVCARRHGRRSAGLCALLAVALLAAAVGAPQTAAAPAAAAETIAYAIWGNNHYWQIDDTPGDRPTPVAKQGLTGVVAFAAGDSHTLALRGDGTVWAWGSNDFGQLGDGTTTPRTTPAPVQGLHDVVAVSARDSYSMVLRADGTVWGWGFNGSGDLGDGTTRARRTPVQTRGLTDVVSIAGSMALLADGTVRAWGEGRTVPVAVRGLSDIVALAAGGQHNMALRENGTVWAWGFNGHGELGDGTTTSRRAPGRVRGITDAVAIAAGNHHSLAVLGDGTVRAWGHNQSGQLGDGSTTHRSLPVAVQGLTGVVDVDAGYWHSLARRRDGTVWAWGDNENGQLGDATHTNRSTPVQTHGLADVVSIAGGGRHNLALASTACWGRSVPSSPFTDARGTVHADAIDCAWWYGIAHGRSPTLYAPRSSVTRAQMASFVARLVEAAGATLPEPRDHGFTDLVPPQGGTHAHRINQLAEAGIVSGRTPTSFAPGQPVTRAQMATFLVNAYQYVAEQQLPAGSTRFTDISGNAHQTNIIKAHIAVFAHGVTDRRYAPNRPVTRAQMASFLTRVLERFAVEGQPLQRP